MEKIIEILNNNSSRKAFVGGSISNIIDEDDFENVAKELYSLKNNKVINAFFAPNNSTWQGVLLCVCDDGHVYYCNGSGRWETYIPPIGEK